MIITGRTSSLLSPRAMVAWALLTGLAAGVGWAQYRVNTQIYGNTSPSVRYGRSYQPNYAGAPTYQLLPSESRNLIYRSGALPSTIRMNYAAVGPMAPQGVAAYVPEPQSFRSSAVTAGNYVNTFTSTRLPAGMSMPAPGIPTMPSGSIRFSMPVAGAPPVSGLSMSSALPGVSPQSSLPSPRVNSTPLSGSVKYSWKF